MKKIHIAVTNDLTGEQRLHKVAVSLQKQGASITITGRKLKTSLPLPRRPYKYKRLRLLFNKGPLFYLEYNIRLFFVLLFNKTNIIVANDLDTLAACFFASKIKGTCLVYDSHELFTEVPELLHRPFKRKIWLSLEKFLLPRIKNAYTVNPTIAEYYNKRCHTDFKVIYNYPMPAEKHPSVEKIQTEKKHIILYQGALNIHRGLEEIIRAMQYIDNAIFYIIGSGDIENQLHQLVKETGTGDKVVFKGKIPFEYLPDYTRQADLGICFENHKGLNYEYALPNKLFDYIQAKVPVFASCLPDIKNIIDKYNIGVCTDERNPVKLAPLIKNALSDKEKTSKWKANLTKASDELSWEKQENQLFEIYRNCGL